MRRNHTYKNTIILDKEKFSNIINRIDKRKTNLNPKAISDIDFKLWSLFAIVFGIFTNYGNVSSTKLFMECLISSYLPEISILEDGGKVKICVKIMQKKLDERKVGIKGRTKNDSAK